MHYLNIYTSIDTYLHCIPLRPHDTSLGCTPVCRAISTKNKPVQFSDMKYEPTYGAYVLFVASHLTGAPKHGFMAWYHVIPCHISPRSHDISHDISHDTWHDATWYFTWNIYPSYKQTNFQLPLLRLEESMRCDAVLNLPPLEASKTAAAGEARRSFGSGGPRGPRWGWTGCGLGNLNNQKKQGI